MERLTYRDANGEAWYSDAGTEQDRLRRLAAYEDTGLEPEDFRRAFNGATILKLAGQALGITSDRLRELAQADKEGRCVVLPEESINARYDVADILQDDLNEADYSEPSVGIYSLTWAEKELWQAVIDGLNSGREEVEKASEEKKNG